MKLYRIPAIVGQTASGKTDVAFRLAILIKDKLGKTAEIISADSRQVYQDIPVSTCQPPDTYLKKIKHHFIGTLRLSEHFNAGDFGNEARKVISCLLAEKKIPIVAGGSGLYINSLLYGLFEYNNSFKETNEEKLKVRAILNSRMDKEGSEALLKELELTDPVTASGLISSDRRRIIRALEVFMLTGIRLSDFHKKKIKMEFTPVIFGIKRERKELYHRINERTDLLLENGLVDEVRELRKKGFHYKNNNSLNTVGIKEVFDFLDSKIPETRMIELIKQNTRRFAKRQMTWFRKDKNIIWIDAGKLETEEQIANIIFGNFFGEHI
jgi:tRNA dimethylallyltransferase